MIQKLYLEPSDIDALVKRGEELTLMVGNAQIALGYAGRVRRNGHETPTATAARTGPMPKPKRTKSGRRIWSDEAKRDAIARVKNGERQVDVARSIGINDSLINSWIKRAKKRG